jgi:hypothetical protein
VRFLAYKLELDERQVGELARILDELKTERAQAEVDRRPVAVGVRRRGRPATRSTTRRRSKPPARGSPPPSGCATR